MTGKRSTTRRAFVSGVLASGTVPLIGPGRGVAFAPAPDEAVQEPPFDGLRANGVGVDPALSLYRSLMAAEEAFNSYSGPEDCAAYETAYQGYATAQDAFIAQPAFTVSGVTAKLEYLAFSEYWSEDDTWTVSRLGLSALRDLRRLSTAV